MTGATLASPGGDETYKVPKIRLKRQLKQARKGMTSGEIEFNPENGEQLQTPPAPRILDQNEVEVNSFFDE